MLRRLWLDDTAAVLTAEYTLLGGVVVFGTLPAMIAARDAASAGLRRQADALARIVPVVDVPTPPADIRVSAAPASALPVYPAP